MRIPAEKRKKMIIRSAIKVFSQSNFRTAKVSDIAELAGITEPMVYRYFHTKKNLFIETLTVIGKKTIQMMNDESITVYNESLLSIEAMNKRYFDIVEKHKEEVKIFYQAISEMDDQEIKDVLQKIYQSFSEMYSSVITEGKIKGQIHDTVDEEAWSWNMVGIIIHLSAFYLLGLYKEHHADQMINQHIALIKSKKPINY